METTTGERLTTSSERRGEVLRRKLTILKKMELEVLREQKKVLDEMDLLRRRGGGPERWKSYEETENTGQDLNNLSS